jgi:hypothetical protein
MGKVLTSFPVRKSLTEATNGRLQTRHRNGTHVFKEGSTVNPRNSVFEITSTSEITTLTKAPLLRCFASNIVEVEIGFDLRDCFDF